MYFSKIPARPVQCYDSSKSHPQRLHCAAPFKSALYQVIRRGLAKSTELVISLWLPSLHAWIYETTSLPPTLTEDDRKVVQAFPCWEPPPSSSIGKRVYR